MSVLLATAGYDHTIRFWQAPSAYCHRILQYSDSQVNRLEITPDRQYIAAAGNPHVRLFEIETVAANPVSSFDAHTGNVTAVGFSQTDQKLMYTGSEDGTVKLWDLRTPKCEREYECRSAVNFAVLHPLQPELISVDQNGNIRVWDLTADACSSEFAPCGDVPMRSVTIATDGSVICAANNKGTVMVWKLLRGEHLSPHVPMEKFEAHSTYILRCLLSPDVRLLATTSADHTVKLWNVDDLTLEKTLVGHKMWVWDCVFSADCAYLLTASSDNSSKLWDISQGEAIKHYTGHHKAVVCVALNDNAPE